MGMPIHNIELVPGKGGQICRSAGCMATIVNKQTEHAIVRLPSGMSQLQQHFAMQRLHCIHMYQSGVG